MLLLNTSIPSRRRPNNMPGGSRSKLLQLVFVLTVLSLLNEGASGFGASGPSQRRLVTTRRHVVTEPSQESTRPRNPNRRSNSVQRHNRSRRNGNKSNQDAAEANGRWKKAEQVEANMQTALEAMKDTLQGKDILSVSFPSVRDCNAAMATFGDGNQLLRALGLFLKMRKVTTMAQNSNLFLWSVPAPTLVTYSTLMSRAARAGKERLALRLWYLMKTQKEFFSSGHHNANNPMHTEIVPDVKAANILMNVHAKLCDVESAQYLMSQMVWGNGTDVPKLEPNVVTYNSLIDACHKAGDLDAALEAKQQLDDSGLPPDARTYTTLIATVGRKASCASGAKDPSMAFSFLNEMVSLGVRPNGMTYSALIDACARCGRTDMALKGLRTMIRQKDKDQRALKARGIRKKYSLFNEVGAWTAAINALGKAGSLDSAMRLFHSMPKSGVQPNTITCGCLADCLLRHGRTSDTLSVLRYMKREGIVPSEVMYTSLITSAGRMVELENRQRWNAGQIMEDDLLGGRGDTKAIEIYTALMKTLAEDTAETDKESTQLMKVFLVFQEMKAAGAEPDLACYNSLLRVCSRAGDVTRAMDIIRKIEKDGLVPNDTSWRAALKSAATARRPDLAEDIWEKGLEIRGERQMRVTWKPSVDSFANLLSAYIREASDCRDNPEKQAALYMKVITMYKDIMTGSSKRKIEKQELMETGRALGMILRAFVSLDFIQGNGKHKMVLRRIAVSIATLDLWKKQDRIENITWKSLQIAERWKKEYDTKDVIIG